MTWGKHAGDVRCCSRWRRQPLSVQRSWTRGRDLSRISTSTNLLRGNVCSVFVLNQTNYCERTRQTTADDGRRTPEDSTLVVFRRRPLSLSLSLSTCCFCWSAGPHRACKAVVVCCCDRGGGGGGDDPCWAMILLLLLLPAELRSDNRTHAKPFFFPPLAVVTKRGTNLLWLLLFFS
jgi:hypothetical protein